MTRPFEGIRVIDVTHVLAGPFAAYQLAVLGADVIRIGNDERDRVRGIVERRSLRARRQRPGHGRAAEKRHEIASSHELLL
jgi:crotonobetainyl-CoA:carnitine CoA-transferase CaiB-like acyl-CoA transferase